MNDKDKEEMHTDKKHHIENCLPIYLFWMAKSISVPDLQLMVYLSILVTRKYLSWQKILGNLPHFVQIVKILFDFPLHPTESFNIFCQTIKI